MSRTGVGEGYCLVVILSTNMNVFHITLMAVGACALGSAAPDQILAPGNPPLTHSMVEHRIAVLEEFLDAHLTAAQNEQFEAATVDAWRRHDKNIIQYTLDDLKLYGNDSQIKAVKGTNQEAYVDRMRDDPNEPLNAVLL